MRSMGNKRIYFTLALILNSSATFSVTASASAELLPTEMAINELNGKIYKDTLPVNYSDIRSCLSHSAGVRKTYATIPSSDDNAFP